MAGFVNGWTREHGAGLTDAGRVVGCATGLFSIAAGVIHVSAAADHQNLPVMMVGFIVVAVLQAALGGLLIWRRPDPLLLVAALGLMLGSVGMWLMSRTSGLPFLPGGHMEPIGFKDSVTVLFELATVPGLLLLMSPDLKGVRLPSARLGTQALGFLSAFVFMLFVPALMLDGGAHHAHGEAGHPDTAGGHSHGDGQVLKAEAGGHEHGGRRSRRTSTASAIGGSRASHGKDGHSHEGSGGGNAELAQADTEAPHGDHEHGGSTGGDTGSGGVRRGSRLERRAAMTTARGGARRAGARATATAASKAARATSRTKGHSHGGEKGKGDKPDDGHSHGGGGNARAVATPAVGTTTAAARTTAAVTGTAAAGAAAATPSPTAATLPRRASSPSAWAQIEPKAPGTRETIKLQYGPFTLAPGADASWPHGGRRRSRGLHGLGQAEHPLRGRHGGRATTTACTSITPTCSAGTRTRRARPTAAPATSGSSAPATSRRSAASRRSPRATRPASATA